MDKNDVLRDVAQQAATSYDHGARVIFQECYCAAMGANIHRGEKDARRLAKEAGTLGVQNFFSAMRSAEDAIEKVVESRLAETVASLNALAEERPEIVLAPANMLNKNGTLNGTAAH